MIVQFVDAVAAPGLYRSRCVNGQAIRTWGGEATVMLALALLLAALGPFGTWAMPFAARLAAWAVFATAGYLCFRPVVAAARVLAAHTRLPLAAALFLACALAALPTTLLVAWALAGMAVTRLKLGALAGFYPQVLLVGLLVTAVQMLVASRRNVLPVSAAPAAVLAEPVPAVAPGECFLDRLPPALGTELLALEQEDHYVRVHTTLGSALLLMRMRDAAAELDAMEGARVHRSWWVARAAVVEVVRRDRAVGLRLVNGLEVPVARASVPELRAAGWF